MTQTAFEPAPEPVVAAPGSGTGLWHLDVLWTFKIPATATGGAFSIAEQLLPKGSAPPMHRHTREDETWLVLDGEMTFFLDEERYRVGPGTYIFGPRGRAHAFRVESDTARIATLLTPGSGEAFFHATGQPTQTLTLPPPSRPDLERMVASMQEHGIEFIGPPPTDV